LGRRVTGARIASAAELPPFDAAPAAVLILGDHEFFVEGAAEEARERLGPGAEVLRFGDEDAPESFADALLNRSLFSERRLVEIDLTSWLGRESLPKLLEEAVGAWELRSPAGRREAFRKLRTALATLGERKDVGDADEAVWLARRAKRPDLAEALKGILEELPPRKQTSGSGLEALRTHLSRPPEGTVLLATAVDPPKGSDLLSELERRGILWDIRSEKTDRGALLARRGAAAARERGVAIEAPALEWLRRATDEDPRLFSAELDKLLEWAGRGGRVTRADAVAQVEDRGAEDVYAFLDALGRRGSGEALERLERLLSGRPIRMGKEREVDADDPFLMLFSVLVGELRKMLYVRSRLEEAGVRGFGAETSYQSYASRIHDALAEPVAPFSESPMSSGKPFGWYKVATRSVRYRVDELVGALRRAAEVDAALKESAASAELLAGFVAGLLGPRLRPSPLPKR
jgi:DNA polymerase III delta subunit